MTKETQNAPAKPTPAPKQVPEIKVLGTILNAFAKLTPAGQKRVVSYLNGVVSES